VKLELRLRSKVEFVSSTVPLQWGKEEATQAYFTRVTSRLYVEEPMTRAYAGQAPPTKVDE